MQLRNNKYINKVQIVDGQVLFEDKGDHLQEHIELNKTLWL
jgi:hypothetical protein